MNKKIAILVLTVCLVLCAGCQDPDQEETITLSQVVNGFLLQEDEEHVAAISSGDVRLVSLEHDVLTFTDNGEEINVQYSWCSYGEALCAVTESERCALTPVRGSSRYLCLEYGSQTELDAVYLADVETKEMIDPLAKLDSGIKERVNAVEISPNGKYALLQCDKGETCLLLTCETGETVELSVSVGMSVCAGNFLDEENLVLLHKEESSAESKMDVINYSITDGTYTFHTGDVMTFYGADFATKTVDGMLAIVDLTTMETSKTQIKADEVQRIFYCAPGKVGIVSGETLYLADHQGNVQTVCAITH